MAQVQVCALNWTNVRCCQTAQSLHQKFVQRLILHARDAESPYKQSQPENAQTRPQAEAVYVAVVHVSARNAPMCGGAKQLKHCSTFVQKLNLHVEVATRPCKRP